MPQVRTYGHDFVIDCGHDLMPVWWHKLSIATSVVSAWHVRRCRIISLNETVIFVLVYKLSSPAGPDHLTDPSAC